MRSIGVFALTTALTSLAANAQEQPILLSEITLTANQTDYMLDKTGASVEIVERERIEKLGAVRTADFMSTLPGVSVTGNGGFGATTDLRLRGLGGQYVKVLLDGMDISDPANTQIKLNWGDALINNLNRIEVLKGPQSALYGSEAIGGVISLYTLGEHSPGLHQAIALEYGSNATASGGITLSHSGEKADIAFTARRFETNGFSVADENDGNTEADGARSTILNFSARYRLTDTITIGSAGYWQKTDAETDGEFPTLADNGDSSHSIRRAGRIYAEYLGDWATHTVSVQKSSTGRTEVYGGSAYPFDGYRTEYSYKGSVDLDNNSLVWGLNHSRESFAESGPEQGYITNSVYGEYRAGITSDFDMALSLRSDHNSKFEEKINGRLAVAWRPADSWVIRGQVGTGFRAPSPYELYNPYAGNPSLQPETSTGYDVSIEYNWSNETSLKFAAFRSSVDDLIINDASTGYVYRQTAGKSTSRGFEISGETTFGNSLTFSGNFTYTDTWDQKGDPLPRVPEKTLNVSLHGPLTQNVDFGLSLKHLSGLVDGGEMMPSVTVIGANLDYEVADDTAIYLRVENLLNEQYQILRGYGTPDRSLYAGLRASF